MFMYYLLHTSILSDCINKALSNKFDRAFGLLSKIEQSTFYMESATMITLIVLKTNMIM